MSSRPTLVTPETNVVTPETNVVTANTSLAYLKERPRRREIRRHERHPDDERRVHAERDVLGLVEVIGQNARLEGVVRAHGHEKHVVAQRDDEASLWHRARQLDVRLHPVGHALLGFRWRAQRDGDVHQYLGETSKQWYWMCCQA